MDEIGLNKLHVHFAMINLAAHSTLNQYVELDKLNRIVDFRECYQNNRFPGAPINGCRDKGAAAAIRHELFNIAVNESD